MTLYCKREWSAEIPDEIIIKAVDKFANKNFYRPSYDLINRKDIAFIAQRIINETTNYEQYPNEFTKPLRERIREIIEMRKEQIENADN